MCVCVCGGGGGGGGGGVWCVCLTEINKVWFYLINSIFKPSKYVSIVRQDLVLQLYALVKGFELDVGKIIKEYVLNYAKNNFSGNIPHPSLITLLCIKKAVRFNEEDKNSPKASPLILIRALKVLVEGEEVERGRKTKRIEEQPREQSLQ